MHVCPTFTDGASVYISLVLFVACLQMTTLISTLMLCQTSVSEPLSGPLKGWIEHF
jgi:hypothetical protein